MYAYEVLYCYRRIPYCKTSISLAGVGAAIAMAMTAAVATPIGMNERMLNLTSFSECGQQM